MQIDWRFEALPSADPTLPPDWQRLVTEHRAGNPALDERFTRLLLKHYGSGRELLALGSAGGRTVAAAIVAPAGFGRWTLFQPGQACLSPVVLADGVDLAAAAPSVAAALPGTCLRLQLPKVDPQFQPLGDLETALADVADYGTTFLIELSGSFDEYWNSRKKRLRQNSRRWFRRIEQEGYAPRLETLTQGRDMPRAVEFHARLESEGWKGAHGSAIGTDNRQGAFYTDLMSEFAANDAAIAFQLYFGDVPAASLLGIAGGGTIVILKTAHNEGLRDCSPGRIIDFLALQQCFAAGRWRAMDMYTRASTSDLSWSTSSRTMHVVDLYRSRLLHGAVRLRRRLLGRSGDASRAGGVSSAED